MFNPMKKMNSTILLLLLVFLSCQASSKSQVGKDFYNCSKYEVSKADKLKKSKEIREKRQLGLDVLKEIKKNCPSPYAMLVKHPEAVISVGPYLSDIEEFVCLNFDELNAYSVLNYFKSSPQEAKECLDEYVDLISDYESNKGSYEDKFVKMIGELNNSEKFRSQLGNFGDDLYAIAKEKKVTLYNSNESFGGYAGVSSWVFPKEIENDGLKLGRYYGVDKNGVIKGYVVRISQKTELNVNEVMPHCDMQRKSILDEKKYLRLPVFQSDELNKLEIYLTDLYVIQGVCDNYGNTIKLTLRFHQRDDSYPTPPILTKISVLEYQKDIVSGKNELANRYITKNQNKIDTLKLQKKSEQIVKNMQSLCPSPIDAVTGGQMAVPYAYGIAREAKNYDYYKSKIRQQVQVYTESITTECLSEFFQMDTLYQEKKAEIISLYESSILKTKGIDHTLGGIVVNKPLPEGNVDLSKIDFQDDYWSYAYIDINSETQLTWSSFGETVTKVMLEEVKDGQPIVRGISIKPRNIFNSENCLVDLNRFTTELTLKGYFEDTQFSQSGVTAYEGNRVFISQGIVFVGSCLGSGTEVSIKNIGDYSPDFDNLTIQNIQ